MNIKEYVGSLPGLIDTSPVIFKHSRGIDCGIQLVSHYFNAEGNMIAEIAWINLVNSNNPFFITKDTITIKNNELENWHNWTRTN